MSVPIVIDEWLFHDLSGENGDDKQQEAFNFLFKILKVCDRVVILEKSPFAKKMGEFIKNCENDIVLREISKFLNISILRNSLKTKFLSEDEVKPLPKKIAKLVPTDDVYLFQAHLALKDSFILTTDAGWPAELKKQESIKIQMRDVFVPMYLKKKTAETV